jgi:hypothetical protein
MRYMSSTGPNTMHSQASVQTKNQFKDYIQDAKRPMEKLFKVQKQNPSADEVNRMLDAFQGSGTKVKHQTAKHPLVEAVLDGKFEPGHYKHGSDFSALVR